MHRVCMVLRKIWRINVIRHLRKTVDSKIPKDEDHVCHAFDVQFSGMLIAEQREWG